MDLDGMKRKDLQSLCKKHGIPANLTNVEMVNRLTKIFKVKENRIVEEGSEKNSEEEDDAPKKKLKKVRFSPDVETREYEASAHVKPLTRRTRRATLVNSALKDSEEESSGAVMAGKKRGRGNVTKRTGSRVTRSQAIIDEEVHLSCSVIEKKNETVMGWKGLTRKKIDGDCVEGEPTKGVRRSTRSTANLTDSEAVQVRGVGRITRKRSRNAVEVTASEKASLPTACLRRSRRKTTVFTVFASDESGEGEAVRKGKQSNETVSGMGVYVTDKPRRSRRNDSRQILQAASNETNGVDENEKIETVHVETVVAVDEPLAANAPRRSARFAFKDDLIGSSASKSDGKKQKHISTTSLLRKQTTQTKTSGKDAYVTDEQGRSSGSASRQIDLIVSSACSKSDEKKQQSMSRRPVLRAKTTPTNISGKDDCVNEEPQRSTRRASGQHMAVSSNEQNENVESVGNVRPEYEKCETVQWTETAVVDELLNEKTPRRSARHAFKSDTIGSSASVKKGQQSMSRMPVIREKITPTNFSGTGDYITEESQRSTRRASGKCLAATPNELNEKDESVGNVRLEDAKCATVQETETAIVDEFRIGKTLRRSPRHAFKNDIIGSSASVGKKQQSISRVPVMMNEIIPTNSSPPIEDTGLSVTEDTGERNLVLNSNNALGSSQRRGEPKTKSRRKGRSSSVDGSTPYSDIGLKIDGVTNLEEIMESKQPKLASTSIEEEPSKVAVDSMDVATSQTDIIGAEMDGAQNSKVRESEPLELVTATPGKEASEVAGESVIGLGNIFLMGERGNGTSAVIIEGGIDDQSGESFYFSGLEKIPAREEITSGEDECYGSDDISNPSAEVDRISIEDSGACLERTEQDNTKGEVEDKLVPDDRRSVPAVSAATSTRSSTEDVCQETDRVNDCLTENEVFIQKDDVNGFERTKYDNAKGEIEDRLVSDDGRSVPAVSAAIVTRSSTEDVCQDTDNVNDYSTEIKVFVQEDDVSGFQRIEHDNKGEIEDKLAHDVGRSVPAVTAAIVTGISTEDVCQETDAVNNCSTEIEIFVQGNYASGFERTEQDNKKEEIEDKLVPDDGRSLPAVSAAIVIRSSAEDFCQETDRVNDVSTEIEMFVQEDDVRGFERTEPDDTTNRNVHGVPHNRQASPTFSAETVEEEIAQAHHSAIAGTSPHSVCTTPKVNDEHPQASSLKLSICGGKLSLEDSERHQDETETTTSDKDLKEVAEQIVEDSLPGFNPGKLEGRKVGNAAIVRTTNDEILCQESSGDCMVGERGSSFNNGSGRPFSPEASSVTRVLDLASEKFHNYKETAVSRNCSVDAAIDVPAIEYCNPVTDIVGNQSMGGKLVIEQHEMEVKDSVCSGVAELDEYVSQMMDGKVNSQMAIKETINDMVMKEQLNSEQCDLTTREGITRCVGVAKILDHGVSEEVAASLSQSTQQSEYSELKDVKLNTESPKSIKGIDRMVEKETKIRASNFKVDASMEFIGDSLDDDNAPEVHDGNLYNDIFEKEKAVDNETGLMADDTHQTQCEEGVKISDVILDHMEVLLNSGDADLVAASEVASTALVGCGKTSDEVKDAEIQLQSEAVELDNLKKRYALEVDTSDFVYDKAADGEEEVGKTEGNLEGKDSNHVGKASNEILFSSHEDTYLKSQDESAFFTNWEVNLMYRDGEQDAVESDEESLEDNSMSKDSLQVKERQTDNENIGQAAEPQVGKVLPLVRDELIFNDDLDGTYVINQEFIHLQNYEDKKLENTSFFTHGGDLAEAAIFGGKQEDVSDKCTQKSVSESLKEAEDISNPFGQGVSETGGYAKDKDAYTISAAKIHIQEELVDEGPVLSVFPEEASHEMERAVLQKTVSGCSQMEDNMRTEVLLSVESYRSKPEIDAGSSSLQQNAKASYQEFEEQLMEDEAIIGENDGVQNASEDPNDPTGSSGLGKDGRDCQEVERGQLVHQYPVSQAASMEDEFDTSDAVTPFQRVLEVDDGTAWVGAFPYQVTENGGLELNLSFGEGKEYKVEKIGAQASQAKLIRGDTEESHENAIPIEQTATQVGEDQEERDISMEDVEVNAFPDAASEQTLKFDPNNLKQVNCANLIVEGVGEAKELMEDMPEKEETTVDQSLAFTNPSVDYLSDITAGDDQSCHLKMQSPNVEQLTCSGMKKRTGRIGLIQRTPEKVIDSDAMKENAPIIKREQVGNVTAPKTLSRRRPLEDLRNY